jgi:integrase
MARAWVTRDHANRVCVDGKATVNRNVAGEPTRVTLRRRRRVPKDDEELAGEVARQLNAHFLMGDLSWFDANAPGSLAQPKVADPTLRKWADEWLEANKPPVIGKHTWSNYRGSINYVCKTLGERRLSQISAGDLLSLRSQMKREGRRDATIKDRLGTLSMLYRDARLSNLVSVSPFDTPLPRRKTKSQRQEHRAKRVTFRPMVAKEIAALLKVLRAPKDSMERQWFGLTEFLVLTGLRWGEGAALKWSDVSLTGERAWIHRTLSKYGTLTVDEPTKTGHEWEIVLRAPVLDLLKRQRHISCVGRTDGWVFPNSRGGALHYNNWLKRGWKRALERSKVKPREGDAQKALRRSYITSSLVCGRLPKEVSGDLGHATARMVNEVYDSFVHPSEWPAPKEIERLAAHYGWSQERETRGKPWVNSSSRIQIQEAPTL